MRLKAFDSLLFLTMKLIKAFDKRENGLKYFDPEKVKNILVVSSTAIGDTLLSIPAISAVRERYPEAKILAHLNIRNIELFDNNPDIDGIIPYYGGYRKFFKTIMEFCRHKFDLALIFHGNEPQATPMAYLSGARFIIKLPNTSEFRFLLSNKDEFPQWDTLNGIEKRLVTARLAGCSTDNGKMELLLQDNNEPVDRFLKENNIDSNDILIGFQTGASTVSRMWFADRFIELGRRIVNENRGIKIVLTGSLQENKYCRMIAEGIGDNALVSAGRIALKHMPSLLGKLRLLVTGDTGTMHMAIAVGTPVVALFAVADSRTSGPLYEKERHRVIQKWKTCDPCVGKNCKYQKCMENISVDEVYSSAIELLKKETAA